ncbi:hypothetical protein L1887_51831 [Cichorium endivia]|nr:hypothetical protein L1887_51831 [Cichorium endivia]
MSFSLLSTQPLLRGSQLAARTLRAAPALSIQAGLVRSMHTRPTTPAGPAGRRAWPLKTLGGGLVAGGGWFCLGTTPEQRSFSIHSPAESEAAITGSSTLVRPASPSAPRRQTVTLVFVTFQATRTGVVKSLMSSLAGGSGEQQKWLSWIGYFREAGYDCIQMNLAVPETGGDLADELHQQIRLSNLQRQPVLFVHHSGDADEAAQAVGRYIQPGQAAGGFWSRIFGGGAFSARPAISGLVVISDADAALASQLFTKHPKLNTLVVASAAEEGKKGRATLMDAEKKSHEALVKDIERWLIREGYEG